VRRTRKIAVKVPPGVDDGQHLRLRGQGEASPSGGPAGDFYVFINILPHPQFQRVESDLLLEMPLSFTQAALGTEILVPTLNGRANVKVPAGTQNGTVFRLRGKGMPRLHGIGSGDLHIRVSIKVPTALTERQREILESLAAEFGEERAAESKEKDKSLIDKIVDEVKSVVH